MISIEALKNRLSSQYTLKCFIDLEQLSRSPSDAYLHFQQCYQEAFDHHDRLVLYTSDVVSTKLLQHLYAAANLIDISNFFVLICCPHNIKEQLQTIAELHSTDPVPFQTLQISFDQTNQLQDNFFVPDTICPQPWRNLEVDSQGEVRPCCVYSTPVGNVSESTLQEIFYNDKLSQVRQDFLDGKKPTECNVCWASEDKGLISNRRYHTSLLKKELLTSNLVDIKIRSLDLKPGNTCNFKCRICGPKSSSLFAQEQSKFDNSVSIKTFNWAESNSKTVTEISTLLSSLSNIDMYGGEPFLIKPLTSLVKQAVEQGRAGNMRLHYNSNGSIYPDDLVDLWKEFNHIDIQFSIDNVGSRFELERGGSWNHVESNIKRLIDLKLPNVKISIMPAISIMNVLYLGELLRWATNLNLPVNPLYVTSPPGFDIKNLTSSAKNLILAKFENHGWPEMKNILNYISAMPDSDGHEFIKLCNHFDQLRDQNFSSSHSEIANAMGYVYNSL